MTGPQPADCQPTPPIAGSCGCRWDPAPGSLGGSGPFRRTASCGQGHRWPGQAPGLSRLCPDCALTLPTGALAHDRCPARAACGTCGITAAARCTGCGGCECDCTCWDETTWAIHAQAVTARLPLERRQP